MASIRDIEQKVLKVIYTNNLIGDTNKVYVATSGGADSMALLAFMLKYRDLLGIQVGAVHINHGIRGVTARRDAEFVRLFCSQNGIEFYLFDAERDNIAVPTNASEEWARQLRYNYFESLIKSQSNSNIRIATAHTMSDQTETVLFRMARGGSGLNGLSGIPVKRGYFIRPFLNITRAEVEALVSAYGTGYITDETNLGDDYSRNKIRHNVVPVLKSINPNAEESFGKVCDRINRANEYILSQAKARLRSGEVVYQVKYKVGVFLGIHSIILEYMLLQLLLNIDCNFEQVLGVFMDYMQRVKIMDEPEKMVGAIQLTRDVKLVVTTRYLTVIRDTCNVILGASEGYNLVGNLGYALKIKSVGFLEYCNACKGKQDLCKFADISKLDLRACTLRTRRDGDVFKPARKMGGKLVKFIRNIPLADRNSIPVVEYNGQIIWVWGVGFTDGFTPALKEELLLTERDKQKAFRAYMFNWEYCKGKEG